MRLTNRAAVHLFALSAASVLGASTASAFKPNEAGHLGITTAALAPITRSVDGQTVGFSERALREIRDANRNVDLSLSFFGVAEHFDDEAFEESSGRLVDLKESVVSKITAATPDGFGARQDLGGALHTLQDFYSHSNWVEMGKTTIESQLGRNTFGAPPLSVATCPGDPSTLGSMLSVTTTGYFPFPDPCAVGLPDGTPVGKCRHGVEFFCEGINKDAPGRIGYPEARDLAIPSSADYVNQILDDPRVASNGAAIRALMDAEAMAQGTLLISRGGVDRGVVRTIPVPVDSAVDVVRFQIDLERLGSIDVRRPSGAAVLASDPDATIVEAAARRIVTVSDPAPGKWRVQLSGEGKYAVYVTGTSDLQFDAFRFVTFTGRFGHEGFVPIGIEPSKNTTEIGLAELMGSVVGPKFRLLDAKGKILNKSVLLVRGNRDASASEFIGPVSVPAKPFRLGVRGKDAAGFAFERVYPVLFRPE